MPNCLANSDCFIFLSTSIVFISILSIACILLIFKTLVKMKKDKIIAAQIGQRLKEFRLNHINAGTQRLANAFNKDHKDEPIKRGQITNWENSPGWEYLLWLNKRYRLNLNWALKGNGYKLIEI